MREFNRLPQLLEIHGVRRPFDVIETCGPQVALQNVLNLHFNAEQRFGRLIIIGNRSIVESWVFNRHKDRAFELHKYIKECNHFLEHDCLAVLMWLLLGSIIPRGKSATETSFVATVLTLERPLRTRNIRYREVRRTLNDLGPITLANDTVTFDDQVDDKFRLAVEAHNSTTVELFNVLEHALGSLKMSEIRFLDIHNQLSNIDQIQALLENVIMHETTRLNLTKRQQVRMNSVKYHLANLLAMLESVCNLIRQYGPNALTQHWVINQFCITGHVTERRATNVKLFGSLVHECNHHNHTPFDSNPVNNGRANNLQNQCQKICSVNKLLGCRCDTGQCVLKIMYIENQAYFEEVADMEQDNPLSRYKHHEQINGLRKELAMNVVATCARYYYPPPAYLILILMNLDNR